MKRLYLLIPAIGILTLSVFMNPLSAAPSGADTTGVHSLTQAIKLAVNNNPAVQAAKRNWEAAQEEIPVSGAWANPTLSYTQFAAPVETRNGPQQQQIGLQQMIPLWGTTGLKRQATVHRAQKAHQNYLAARQETIAQVKSVWAALYKTDQSMREIRKYRRLIVTVQEIARTRYATGKGNQAEVLKSQLELSQLDERLLRFSELRQQKAHSLNRILNRPISGAIGTIDTLILPEHNKSKAELMQLLANHRQDLLELRELMAVKESMVSIAQRRNLPSVGLGVNYIRIGETALPGAPEPGSDALALMVRVDLPLWFGANKSRVQSAKSGVSETRFRYADRRNTAESEVRTLDFQLRQSRETLALYRESLLPQAKQAFDAALAGYKTGELGFLDLLDSERTLLKLRLNYLEEQRTYFSRFASLEQALGTQLTDGYNPLNNEGERE